MNALNCLTSQNAYRTPTFPSQLQVVALPRDNFQKSEIADSHPSYRPFSGPVGRCFRKLALATAIAVSTFSAVAPMPAWAAQPVAVTMQMTQPTSEHRQAFEQGVAEVMATAGQQNMKELGPQCVDTSQSCKADFARLPETAQQTYRKMPLGAKQVMASQVNKSTKFMGITVVNHRKAFVKGEAFGQNVFEFATKKVNEQEQQGKINPGQAGHVRYFLKLCSGMNGEQRESLIRIITEDVHLAK